MTWRLGISVLAGLFLLPLPEGSGQDAHFYGRLADREFFAMGRIPEALKLYRQAFREARPSDTTFQVHLLNNIGAMQLSLFRYGEAEQTLMQARKLAADVHNDTLRGSVDGNLAAVHEQMDDLPTAELYAREAIDALSRTSQTKQRPRALLTLANILSREQSPAEGERLFVEGIEAAKRAQDWALASSGWTHYGRVLLESGRLAEADRAFTQSRSLLNRSGNRIGEDALLWNVSRLRLRQHNPCSALESIDSAIRVSANGGRLPTWRLYETRAEVELAQGSTVAALRDARTALDQTRTLRTNIIPDNDNRVGTEGLEDEAYSTLIDAGNEIYLKTHDGALLRETLEAAEENRAESLEALLPTASDWRSRLPVPQYWDKLSELVAEQGRVIRLNSISSRERVARLHRELSEMEAAAKATVHVHSGPVVLRVEKNLPPDASFLSFRLGDRESWLWAMNHGGMQLYRLPPKAALAEEIRDFQKSILDNDAERIASAGGRLYAHLFGGLDAAFARSSQWFISVDEPLYTVPLAALVVRVDRTGPVYLAQNKTLQVLPGAQLFDAPLRDSLREKRFVAAGDGIYNRADPRYEAPSLIRPASWSLARLPASGNEVRFASELWPHHALLTGTDMTSAALIKQIEGDPDVIHIASHVIAGQDRWRAGILALGMDKSGEPDLLTPQEILLHPIHSRLVVMTGCSSGTGDALPASGLMGLTRAWLAAGAGEVLATRWATRDEDQDGLIGSFYRHLLASPDGNIPKALQESGMDMMARGGWRAEPRYWSSFFLIGVR